MAYATIEMVKGMCPMLFNQTNKPTDPDVRLWLDEGAAIIDGRLSSGGYSVPIAKTASAWPLVRNLNTVYASAMAEQTKLVATSQAGETTRGEILERRFWDRLEKVLRLDLSGMGVSHSGSSVYVGGISHAEKNSVESDSDRIMTTFRRGMHSYPGAGTTEATITDNEQER